jgi:hypothetical protein
VPADHMANDDHPTSLLASDGAADRCAPPAPTAGIPRTADLGRGNFAGMEWASADLRKKLAAVDAWPLPLPASPARLFGSSAGAMALADAVGATEPRRIERLEARMVEVEARVPPAGISLVIDGGTPAGVVDPPDGRDRSRPRQDRTRSKQKTGVRGVKNDPDYWLDRWERDVFGELRAEGVGRDEALNLINERVKSHGAVSAAAEINFRYRTFNRGEKVISASSLRRRPPPTTTTDAAGKTVRITYPFDSKRWAEWEPHRKGALPEDRLADGSTEMKCEGEDVVNLEHPPRKQASAAEVSRVVPKPNTEQAPLQNGKDDRKRSPFDGGLQTANMQELAEQAIAERLLIKHEGGRGVLTRGHTANVVDAREDKEERANDAFLREHGYTPSAVHREKKKKKNDGDKDGRRGTNV